MSELVEIYKEIEQAGELWMKNHDFREIAREMGINQSKAREYVSEWKNWMHHWANESSHPGERVTDVIDEVDQHYGLITKEAWATVEQADANGNLSAKNNALKLAKDTQKDRAELIRQAAESYDSELVQEMQETQKTQELIMEVLREVADKYPEAASYIKERLGEISGNVEVIEVERESD